MKKRHKPTFGRRGSSLLWEVRDHVPARSLPRCAAAARESPCAAARWRCWRRRRHAPEPLADACAYDMTDDGLVSTNDLLYILAAFGRSASETPSAARADVNGDGIVGTTDLLGLLAMYGRRCGAPPIVAPEAAAAEFAAELAAAAAFPSTPIIAVVSQITFDGDVSLVAEGTQARAEFEAGFAAAMASSLGDGENSCWPTAHPRDTPRS